MPDDFWRASIGARNLLRGGGDIGQNFIHEFHSCAVLEGHRQNFGSGDIQQKCTHQRLLKKFEKFIKNLQENLKHFPKFFKNKI